jgi:hypothetical protein
MDFNQTKRYQSGFLTLEILLAMAIMIITLSAAVLMSFGGQSLAVDSRLNSEALNYAQKLLEEQRLLALKDFRLVNSANRAEGIFKGKIKVARHSFFAKNVNIEVEWDVDGRPQKVGLETLIADYNGTAGNDTCDSNLSGDWTNPQIKEFDFSQLTGVASSTISDIDAYKGKLYVTVGDSATSTDPTFFVFDISNPDDIKFPVEKIDNSSNKSGLNAVAVNGDYAYAANNSADNQLQIFNLKIFPIKSPAEYDIKGVNGGKGNSIFYKNGYVYLGLTSTSNNTSEFHIVAASSTTEVGHWPSIGSLNSAINDIYISGDYAYLAVADNGRELIVLNISNPAAPVLVNEYNIVPDQTNWGNGKSIEVIGDNIYLGRTYIANSPEFYIFDVSNQSINIIDKYPKSNSPFSANGLVVRNYLAFVLAGSETQGGNLKILDISNPTNIIEKSIVDLPNGVTGSGGVAMDCEGNYIYVGSVDGAGKSYLSVITAK